MEFIFNIIFIVLQGGLTFIIGKGLLKISLRQWQYVRISHRKILNFVDVKT